MADQIEQQALIPLTAAILQTWATAQILQLCNLGTVTRAHLETWPKHDTIKVHGLT